MLIARSQRDCDNAATDKPLKPSLKELLAESHIAAVAIALLLFWGLEGAVQSAVYLGMVVLEARHGFGSLVYGMWGVDALGYFAAAAFLSRWVYTAGPFESLKKIAATWRTTENA
jgi:hypothetical protein